MTMRVPEVPRSARVTSNDIILAVWLHYFSEVTRKLKEVEDRLAALEAP